MINQVKKTIDKHRLLEKGDRIIVAVSGGPDSVALLKILQELSPLYKLTLKVAHLNHGLRGDESDREEAFVKDLSASLGLSFASKKADIPRTMKEERTSLEDACRKERFEYLEEQRRAEAYQKVAIGQHLDDQAETVLMRFLRGSGPDGLKGMLPIRNGIFIRPLIERSRREIIAYLEGEGMNYMRDSSNEKDFCLRNRIRLRLMPELLSQYNPRLSENIVRMSEIFRREDDYLRDVVVQILSQWGYVGAGGKAVIPLKEFHGLHQALQARIVKEILLQISPSKKGIGYRHIHNVLKIVEGKNPSALMDMPFNIQVKREYDALIIEKREKPGNRGGILGEEYSYDVRVPGELEIPETGCRMVFELVEKTETSFLSRQVVFMDADSIAFPLVVRNRQPGDRIEPLGMTGTKKVKEIFIESKIPKARRRFISLLADRSSILWIVGIRLSDRVKITERTKRVLKIEIY